MRLIVLFSYICFINANKFYGHRKNSENNIDCHVPNLSGIPDYRYGGNGSWF